MSQHVSEGFVSYIESIAVNPASSSEVPVHWDSPILQVIDIQLFKDRSPSDASPRFYLALSDTKSLLWGIAPPSSALEAMIKDSILEIGSLVCVDDYAIVMARNKRKVLVLASVSVSNAAPLSLIGHPLIDDTIFHLSSNSLVEKQRQLDLQAQLLAQGRGSKGRRSTGSAGDHQQQPPQQRNPVSARKRTGLATLWNDHEVLGNFENSHLWYVYVRVVWKSKLRKIVGGGDADSAGSSSRCIFDAIVVDENGDAVKVVFNGGRKLHEKFQVPDCLFLGSGTVCLKDRKRTRGDDGEEGDDVDVAAKSQYVPSHLLITETSLIQLAPDPAQQQNTMSTTGDTHEHQSSTQLAPGCASSAGLLRGGAETEKDPHQQLPTLPQQPRRLLQGAETEYMDVQEVLTRSSIGDIICLQGTLISHDPSITQITTRNGRVDKLGMMLRDRARRSTIGVTLWGSVAHSLTLPLQLGTTWLFRDVTVRAFGSNLTISSRSSSEVTMQPSIATSTVFGIPIPHNQQVQEVCLTYAPTTQVAPPPPFTLDLPNGHSSVVPSLLRIQYVSIPMTYNGCLSCGTKMNFSTCPRCHSVRSEPRYCIELILSDGLESIRAVAMGDVGTSLCGEQARSFTAKCVDPDYPIRLASILTGRSVLVELAHTPSTSSSEDVSEYKCTSIQHVHHAACCHHMVSMINKALY